MLVLLLAASSVFAQFTPPSYNFFFQPQENTNGLPDGSNLLLTWESANGYGQWAADKDGKWYLLSNRLQTYDLEAAEQISTGVATSGDLGFLPNDGSVTRDIKVTCNLLGDVRYVWPDESPGQARKRFVLNGFSEQGRGGNPPIDIDFRGIPKPLSTRKVIDGAIQTFPFIATTIGGTDHPVCTPAPSSNPPAYAYDWRDEFDVACDAYYLYVVWEERLPANVFKIYANVVKISDGTPVAGWPKLITNGAYPNDRGRRPTVACDIRNNTDSQNPAITFDIAYISNIPAINVAGGGQVMHVAVMNGVVNPPIPQPLIYQNPVNLVDENNQPRLISYNKPLHARMLVASVPGITSPLKGIYVLCDDGDNTQLNANLIFHKVTPPNAPAPFAFYVDGPQINSHPAPLQSGQPNNFYPVWNTPIIAFANPYDEGSPAYDEFHCIYSLDASTNEPTRQTQALHIVRNYDNGIYSPIEARKILNAVSGDQGQTWDFSLGDPGYTSLDEAVYYCGSVNQMGIHTHWQFWFS